ncbi:hypothetical protein QFC19_002512 [Naganishia cerealis]|uniref:Uncharacterized protein n=1 Tax=Naganishia cerealis TaxID=610337 RepID=A0ACC2W922_9TREE|nr:hypothetical protein QFC19_002512 [Naganishia cerealis]
MAAIETPVSRRLATVKNIIIVISGKGELRQRDLDLNKADSVLIQLRLFSKRRSWKKLLDGAACAFTPEYVANSSSRASRPRSDGSFPTAHAGTGWSISPPVVQWLGAGLRR